MTTLQKVIKYLAIAFAIFLIVNIISAILFAFYSITYISGLAHGENNEYKESIVRELEYSEVDMSDLNIEVDFSNLIIKKGASFRVETDSNYVKCDKKGETLHITEEGQNWFTRKKDIGELTIYVPDNLEFEKVKISAGAGKINIEEINTKKLSLEIGAGETKIGKLDVTDKADIDGGAGKVEISSGIINNLDLDMGVGKVDITAKLTGNIDIDAGVGELDINIKNKKEDYKIKTSKGIGSITIDGKALPDDTLYGEGQNYMKIDGGIGSIKVDFEEN